MEAHLIALIGDTAYVVTTHARTTKKFAISEYTRLACGYTKQNNRLAWPVDVRELDC